MTNTRNRTRRLLALALAAAGCAGVTACGSANPSAGSAGSSSSGSGAKVGSAGIRFSQCMRTHGVPNFPDPSGSGGGIQLPAGANPFSPSFKAAQNACHSLMPFGGPGRGQPSAARKEQLVQLAQCMRSKGITSFPDPTNSPPSAPPSGGGVAFGGPGGFISIPQSVMQSPGFQQDASECHFPGGGPPPAGHAGPKSLTLK